MRVISGSRKGHKLVTPKGMEVRPTEDRAKESMFNIIAPIYSDEIALDLFAGSGSIGIEFLSRGAKLVYFVDFSDNSIKAIYDNLEHTRFLDSSKVIKSNSDFALKDFSLSKIKFDYIFLDPPYENIKIISKCLLLIDEYELLSPSGIVVAEHLREVELESSIGKLKKYDHRIYGKRAMTYYKIEEV